MKMSVHLKEYIAHKIVNLRTRKMKKRAIYSQVRIYYKLEIMRFIRIQIYKLLIICVILTQVGIFLAPSSDTLLKQHIYSSLTDGKESLTSSQQCRDFFQ